MVASVNISTGSPLAPASPGACSAGLKRSFEYLPIPPCQPAHRGRLAPSRIDKRRLQTSVGTIELGEVRRLVMDEFALHKGHRYATVIMDAEQTRVLWVGHGNSRAAIRPFFEQLGERCQQIEAVAMDMNTAFDLEVKQHCPQAEVVYDLFHVVARYGREVVDRVRVEQAECTEKR